MARKDPYRNFRFAVSATGLTADVAGFQKVSGLKKTVEVVEYREGVDPSWPRKLAGQASFDNITLERGYVSGDSEFMNWLKQVADETGTDTVADQTAGSATFHQDVTIDLKNKTGGTVRTWVLTNAWPASYTVADMDASGNDVLIQSLELAYENLTETATAG